MRIARTLAEIPGADLGAGTSIAIGKFDGLHRGHQAILELVRETAQRDSLQPVVLTFTQNPLSYLRPEACPQPLMSPSQRLEAFADAGMAVCVMLDFDAALASMPAADFVTEVLVNKLGAKHVIMGGDFRFGHHGAGDGALLKRMGAELGFTVEVVDMVSACEGRQVSSSRIREAVLAGDVTSARRMLGRLPAVRGEVVHGDARGREIGFPTANLGGGVEGLVPADGVYAGWVVLADAGSRAGASPVVGDPLPAAISVGNNPTFTPDAQSRVEAFILDFEGDLYGKRMEVRFLRRLRGTERFDSLEALLEQMDADVVQTRALLSETAADN